MIWRRLFLLYKKKSPGGTTIYLPVSSASGVTPFFRKFHTQQCLMTPFSVHYILNDPFFIFFTQLRKRKVSLTVLKWRWKSLFYCLEKYSNPKWKICFPGRKCRNIFRKKKTVQVLGTKQVLKTSTKMLAFANYPQRETAILTHTIHPTSHTPPNHQSIAKAFHCVIKCESKCLTYYCFHRSFLSLTRVGRL